ncbi:MAG: hypothetical protein AABX53_02055 [Nanoarchaeota archaeon]
MNILWKISGAVVAISICIWIVRKFLQKKPALEQVTESRSLIKRY